MAGEGQNRKDNAAVIWARYSQIAFIIPAAVVIGCSSARCSTIGCIRAGSF
jgi:hypothetical protein